jgi:hypothetical protein
MPAGLEQDEFREFQECVAPPQNQHGEPERNKEMSGTMITRQKIPVTRPFVGKEEEQAVLEVLRSGRRRCGCRTWPAPLDTR